MSCSHHSQTIPTESGVSGVTAAVGAVLLVIMQERPEQCGLAALFIEQLEWQQQRSWDGNAAMEPIATIAIRKAAKPLRTTRILALDWR